jgi:hypothetical protein
MHEYSQSSQFAVSLNDVLHLLRYAPYLVRATDAALLHYSTPHGIWQGAPVHYKLLQGLHVAQWQGVILNPTGRGFFVRTAETPMGAFQASHLYECSENITVIRDTISLESSVSLNTDKRLQIVYHFAQRREMASMQAESPTSLFTLSTLELL